jgi:alpha-maltose-1-phosphate synthase
MARHPEAPLRIRLLCEGDAESFDSWSGISRSVLVELRRLGHHVDAYDADLYGLVRWLGILASWSPIRRRWWARYHLGAIPFELRSRKAAHLIQGSRENYDITLQFGATFRPPGTETTPLFLYCDSNACFSDTEDAWGYDEVGTLPARERIRTIKRESQVYNEATRIFTFSSALRTSFIEDFGIPQERVITVGAGPNIDPPLEPVLLRPDRQSVQPPTVLFVGRAFSRKGGDLLLEAFSEVRDTLPEARLIIIGPDRLPSTSVIKGVDFRGFLNKDDPEEASELLRAYTEADVFCLPTRYEPYGVVFIEAMLYGLPCVGPKAWAVPEIIEHGTTGLLATPDNAHSFAQAILELLRDRERAQCMGKVGRDQALGKHLWKQVVGRMVESIQVSLQTPPDRIP